jgi:hypothetical protein
LELSDNPGVVFRFSDATLKALANRGAEFANAFSVTTVRETTNPGLFQPWAEISERLRRNSISERLRRIRPDASLA